VVIGILENLAGPYISSAYKDLVAVVVLLMMGLASDRALGAKRRSRYEHAQHCGMAAVRLLGGRSKSIPAYIALGFQPPEGLPGEARGLVGRGYRAIKLRIGDTWQVDVERVRIVREALGDSIDILVDANTNYTVDDVRRVMPAFNELGVGWLEEPLPPHDARWYCDAKRLGTTPLAGRREPLHSI
jgi:L-alanine-DL-glutamate epimerase-like enolase superfamily enzyme